MKKEVFLWLLGSLRAEAPSVYLEKCVEVNDMVEVFYESDDSIRLKIYYEDIDEDADVVLEFSDKVDISDQVVMIDLTDHIIDLLDHSTIQLLKIDEMINDVSITLKAVHKKKVDVAVWVCPSIRYNRKHRVRRVGQLKPIPVNDGDLLDCSAYTSDKTCDNINDLIYDSEQKFEQWFVADDFINYLNLSNATKENNLYTRKLPRQWRTLMENLRMALDGELFTDGCVEAPITCEYLCFEQNWDTCKFLERIDKFIKKHFSKCGEKQLAKFYLIKNKMYEQFAFIGGECPTKVIPIDETDSTVGKVTCPTEGMGDVCEVIALRETYPDFSTLVDSTYDTKQAAQIISHWEKIMESFIRVAKDIKYNNNTLCAAQKDFTCGDLCNIDFTSVYQYVDFAENLFRSKLGKCIRFNLWENRIRTLEELLNMQEKDKIVNDTCTGTCYLVDLDNIMLPKVDLALKHLADDIIAVARPKALQLIVALQDNYVENSYCAKPNMETFDCSRACKVTMQEQLDSLQMLAAERLRNCTFYHKRFTMKILEFRKVAALLVPDMKVQKLFTDKTDCQYNDVKKMKDQFYEFVVMNYKPKSGDRLKASFNEAYNKLYTIQRQPGCRGIDFPCSTIDPGEFPIVSKKKKCEHYAAGLEKWRSTLDLPNNCRKVRMGQKKIIAFKKRGRLINH